MKNINKFILIICVIMLNACNVKGTTYTQESNLQEQTDTITRQAILDSIIDLNRKSDANILSTNNLLKGNVQAIRIDAPNGHDIFSFPVKYMEFDKEGNLFHWRQVFGSASSNDIKSDNHRNSVTIANISDMNTFEHEKHFAQFHVENNQIIFEFEDSFGDEPSKYRYDFIYDKNGKLYKVKFHSAMIDDYEGLNELIENDNEYIVSINKEDEFGNWTSITLKSSEETTTYNRELFYYTETKPVLLEIELKDKIFFYTPTESKNFFIRYYDNQLKKVFPLLPTEYETEMYGYVDYKIVGNNIYLILETGNSGAMAYNCEEAVYRYNAENNEWEEIGYCADGCEFVGNKIKMPHYDDLADKMNFVYYEMK